VIKFERREKTELSRGVGYIEIKKKETTQTLKGAEEFGMTTISNWKRAGGEAGEISRIQVT
jgi:hypothetical protein